MTFELKIIQQFVLSQPKKHLWFVSILKTQLNNHALENLEAQMKSGTLFPIGILLFGFLVSCRDHVQSKANWLYVITAPHPYEDALTALASGWFKRTLLKKAQLLPVHYYIAKSIQLLTSQIHIQQPLLKKALTGLVSELNVRIISTSNSCRLG